MAKSDKQKTRANAMDVLVVGGGVSGAYTAWRLKEAGHDVALYEKTNRVGGRLWSITPPGMPNLRAELGGMRFLTSHKLVMSLADKLALATEPFLTGTPANLAVLRGIQLRVGDLTKYSHLIYNLSIAEQGMTPGELLVKAIGTLVPEANVKDPVTGETKAIAPRVWEQIKKTREWKGRRLHDWGLWNMLLDPSVLSSEAYALLLEGGGYESLADNWNCAEACQYLLADFPSNVKYRRFSNGFQGLPEELVARFKKVGGTFVPRHTLIAIEQTGKVIQATFHDARTKEEVRVRTKALVLAMPQRPLKIMAHRSPIFLRPDVSELLDSVTAMPAFKVLLGYREPWWEQLGISSGRSTTDLPLRQVYYVGSEKGRGDPNNNNSLLLAAYADGRTENFWSALQSPDKYPLDPAFAKGVRGELGPRAPKMLIDTVSAQLVHMHAPVKIPEPGWAAFADWTKDYGGGWHFWNPGVDVGDKIGRVRRPRSDVPIYICGEAYANEQGWVEGTLKSAEHVLQDHFGLPQPSWLPAGYFLGP